MVKNKQSKHAKAIIEDSMSALGLSRNMKTDPVVMKSILEELEIDDLKTTFSPMNKFFKEVINTPKSLKPMLESIEHGLITKHPAIIEFLELALKKKWLHKSEKVQRSVQITFVLEAMTAAMCNNHAFFLEAEKHYRAKEKMLGLDKENIYKTILNFWGKFQDLFKVAKIIALDPLMIYFTLQKGVGSSLIAAPDLKKLRKEKKINYFEYKLLYKLCEGCSDPTNKLIRINIYEAGITEYKRGFKLNAMSAYALAEDLEENPPQATFAKGKVLPEKSTDKFYNAISGKENVFFDLDTSQEWVSLYITWNLAFILGNLHNLDLLFPKLLMPSIINAKSNNFMGARVISLWLSINHFLFRDSKRRKTIGPSNKVQMAKAWGKINKKYSLDLVKNTGVKDPKEFMEGYDSFFRHPIYRMFILVRSFFKKTCK